MLVIEKNLPTVSVNVFVTHDIQSQNELQWSCLILPAFQAGGALSTIKPPSGNGTGQQWSSVVSKDALGDIVETNIIINTNSSLETNI